MKKIGFAIFAALLVTLTFGAMTASAKVVSTQAESDCVMLSGTVIGQYSPILPCEDIQEPLENIPVTISEPSISGKEYTTMTTVTTTKFFGLKVIPGGDFAVSVYKGLTYTISIDVTLNIDGVDYKFEHQQEVSVGESDVNLGNIIVHGSLVKPDSKVKGAMFQSFLNIFAEKFPRIFALF